MTSEISSKQIWSPKSILILGHGYIGHEIYKYLTFLGYDPTIVDRETLDYHNENKLWKYLVNEDIKYVINTFGFTGRPNVDEGESRKEECWDLNVVKPIVVAKLCNKLEINYIHISSGCIYTGYEHEYSESYPPNFGLYNESSFYSKSKHAFETLTRDLKMKLLRIRMPICYDIGYPRNYLNKLMKYPNLIDYKNSKTFIPDLCAFINALIVNKDIDWNIKQDIYNVVNPEPLSTKEVVEQLNSMNEGKWANITANWVDVDSLKLAAPRSNCVLSNHKASQVYELCTETEFMNMICNNINGVQDGKCEG